MWKKVQVAQAKPATPVWRCVQLKVDPSLSKKCIPNPITQTPAYRDKDCRGGHFYASSGSDATLVMTREGKKRGLICVASETRTVIEQFHQSQLQVPAQSVQPESKTRCSGDRMSDGTLFCSLRDSEVSATKLVVEAGKGATRVLSEKICDGSLPWIGGLSGIGSINTANPQLARARNKVMLFDLSRGDFSTTGEIDFPDKVQAGISLSSDVNLIAGRANFYLTDMRNASLEAFTRANESPHCQSFSGAAVAGCRAFFSKHAMPWTRSDPDAWLTAPTVPPPILGLTAINAGCMEGGIMSVNPTYDYNPSRNINGIFSWNPARGSLCVSMSRFQGEPNKLRMSARLLDPRRGYSVEVPGSVIFRKREDPTQTPRQVMPSHIYAPTHVTGLPGLTILALENGFSSFLIL